MSITISLPPEIEDTLRRRAAERGQTIDGYVRQIVEREVLGTNGERSDGASPTRLPSDEALAPFRREVVESGMTDDELIRYFEEVREEVWQDKQGRPGQGS